MRSRSAVLYFWVFMVYASVSPVANAEPVSVTIKMLSAPTAVQSAVAAYDACLDLGYQVAVSVVGRDGRQLAFVRSPLAGPHTVDVAQGKAYTANTFQTSTSRLMGRDFMRDMPGVLIIGGGMPIQAGGIHYGAIGVSGAPGQQSPGDVDERCAKAGIAAVKDELELAGE